MKHKWGDIYILQLTPFETVCKQFINGSVPFVYSLNSGIDMYDSWFSDDVWQMVTSAYEMPADTVDGVWRVQHVNHVLWP